MPEKLIRIRKCATCGIEFIARYSRSKYCSLPCRVAPERAKHNRRKQNPPIQCTVCGKEFYSSSSRAKYCSRKCWNEAVKTQKRRQPHIRPCDFCGKEFIVDKPYRFVAARFCSRKCASRWQKTQPHPDGGQRVQVSCAFCGKPVDRWQHEIGKYRLTFCNRQHKQLYNSQHTCDNTIIADRVWERDNHRCVLCNSWRGLLVHHVDGNHSHVILSNMITLCSKCHRSAHIALNNGSCTNGWKARPETFTKAMETQVNIKAYLDKLYESG